jgi:predicted dehydrogenase
MATPIPINRPVRVALVGVGKICDLTSRAYTQSVEAEVVGLCDPDSENLERRGRQFPDAARFSSLDDLLQSSIGIDMVEIGVPTPMHCEVACRVLDAGHHVNLQKPMATSLDEADRMIAASHASGAALRVMEPFIFFEPLETLKAVVESGEIGDVAGFHMKMVGTGLGGWDVPWSTLSWQFRQMQDKGLGILVFDDGWHKFAVANWLFGPVAEVMAWVGQTKFSDEIVIDAPATIMWNHVNGVRGVFDLTLAPDTYMRSKYYSSDERFEVTGTKGFARVNHCVAYGLNQPSLEVYSGGVMRSYHELDDDWGTSFVRQTEHYLRWLRTGEGELVLDASKSREVLSFVLAAIESSKQNTPLRLSAAV